MKVLALQRMEIEMSSKFRSGTCHYVSSATMLAILFSLVFALFCFVLLF